MSRHHPDGRRIVFSTDRTPPALCPECGRTSCRCRQTRAAEAALQAPRVRRELKGRGGKTVTVVYDLSLPPAELQALTRTLKQSCASGGTVKDGRIEIQGDHRDRVVAELLKLGYRAKAAGG